jgi:hypothetical protein
MTTQVLKMLRQRHDLEEYDTSIDDELKKMVPLDALRECCAWQIGDPLWATWFISVANGCGYKIKEK